MDIPRPEKTSETCDELRGETSGQQVRAYGRYLTIIITFKILLRLAMCLRISQKLEATNQERCVETLRFQKEMGLSDGIYLERY